MGRMSKPAMSSAFSLIFPAGRSPFSEDLGKNPIVAIDDEQVDRAKTAFGSFLDSSIRKDRGQVASCFTSRWQRSSKTARPPRPD